MTVIFAVWGRLSCRVGLTVHFEGSAGFRGKMRV